MSGLSMSLVLFVAMFHLTAFVLEAFLWMRPGVYETVLPRLVEGVTIDPYQQAGILRALLINQGFYNLFIAVGALSGLALLRSGRTASGRALAGYSCLSAAGAGIVLASSTTAYIGAALQALPAALACLSVLRTMDLALSER